MSVVQVQAQEINNNLTTSSPLESSGQELTEYDSKLEKNVPILSESSGPEGELLLPYGRGRLFYEREFLNRTERVDIFRTVKSSKRFERTAIEFTSKNVKYLQPRDTLFYGDKLYSYGGEVRQPIHWTDDGESSESCKKLANKIEEYLLLPKDYFNVVLINKYFNGKDFMEWHSDNEKNLGDEPIIASISLGQQREFLVRPRKDAQDGKPVDIINYKLQDGSLLIMSGKMQRFYQHCVPRVENGEQLGMRLNFTFRRIEDENDFSVHPTEG